jgi:general secretion pathway protein N
MKIKIILLFVLFYLSALVITLPASLASHLLPENSGVEISNPSGVVWQGKAVQITYNKKYILQQVTWHVDWPALLKLQLKLDMKFNNGSNFISGKGALIYGLNGALLENVFIDLSAEQLLSYVTLPLPIEGNGDISVVIKQASQGVPYCQQLDAYIVWDNATINSQMGNVDLASVNIDVSCEKGEIIAQLRQQSSQIESALNASLRKEGAYQLQGLIKGTELLEPSIQQALSWIGRKNNSGATVVNVNGHL